MNLIVDGNNLACRWQYKMDLSTSDGFPTSAVYGMFKSIRSVMNNRYVESVTVVWDGGHSDRRQEIYDGYKEKSGSSDGEIRRKLEDQMDVLQGGLLNKVGICSIRIEGREADDLAYLLTKALEDTAVLSNDEDFVQMVDEDNYMLKGSSSGNEKLTVEDVVEEYGFTPDVFPVYRAITGDDSDCIPGVKGFGEVKGARAAKAIYDYVREDGDFYDIPEKIRGRIRKVKRNVDLIDLDRVEFPWGEVKKCVRRIDDDYGFSVEGFERICERLEFGSFEEDIDDWIGLFAELRSPGDALYEDWKDRVRPLTFTG